MKTEDHLAKLEMRQEAIVAAIHGLTDIMAQTRDLVTELMTWLQQPPSSDLSDTLKAILETVQAQNGQLQAVGEALRQLPAQVARAVKTGEL